MRWSKALFASAMLRSDSSTVDMVAQAMSGPSGSSVSVAAPVESQLTRTAAGGRGPRPVTTAGQGSAVVTGRSGRRAAPVLTLRQSALADGVLAGLDHVCQASGVSPSLCAFASDMTTSGTVVDRAAAVGRHLRHRGRRLPHHHAAAHSWRTPSTYGFIAAGVVLLAAFAAWQGRAAHPLLPPRVVLDRNRGGAYASMLLAGAGLFGTFFFLTYYLQQTLGYSPLLTGLAFLPISAGSALTSNLATIVLMPRFGPKPLVASGMLAAAGAMAWLAQLGPHTGYATGVLGPLIQAAIGMGLVIAPSINTGTFGVAPQDAGVASATVTVGQQLGASIGTSLLNTIFASAVASYLAANLAAARIIGRPAPTGLALAHGYDTAGRGHDERGLIGALTSVHAVHRRRRHRGRAPSRTRTCDLCLRRATSYPPGP
jgi:hypothetical protein